MGEANAAATDHQSAQIRATVVITTKNRKDELRVALRSAIEQTAQPEVLVIDDGSTDGTGEMVRAEFPAARFNRSENSLGLVVQRNRAAQLARGGIIFSIDDDAAFSSSRIVEQTLAEFDDPRIGAVAIPYINVNNQKVLYQRAPSDEGIFCGVDYIGTAHAVRRDLFLRLGGYREYLFHQGEERDFCIRMLNAGYVVRLGRADPIHHFESPHRDLRRMDLFGRRNDVLSVWYNVPWPWFPMYLLGTTFLGVMRGIRLHRLRRMIRGLWNGYAAIFHEFGQRAPVSRKAFELSRKLMKGPMALDEIEKMLPPIK
jgi:glycosyltransferase involved in cell wall biosynthesis